MRGLRKWKPSPAMVVAMTALAIAMAGTATAQRGSGERATTAGLSKKKLNAAVKEALAKHLPKALPKAFKKMPDAGYVSFFNGFPDAEAAFFNGALGPALNNFGTGLFGALPPPSAMSGQLQGALNNLGTGLFGTLPPPSDISGQLQGALNNLGFGLFGAMQKPLISTVHLKASSITANLISNGAVTRGAIANNAVTSSALTDNAVTGSAIADDAVGPAHVQDVTLSNLALKTGWSTSPADPAHYVIDAEGVVHLRGLLLRAGHAGPIAFQLPAGVRPSGASDREMPVIGAGGGCGGVSTTVPAYIQGNGVGDALGGVSFTPADCGYYHLDSISYVP